MSDISNAFLLPCCARDYISFILSIIFWISWLYWSQLSKWGRCLIVERLISLSLSKNQFILYQFLVECLLISFERIWKFKFSWFVNCSRFEINKKKMTLWLEWLMFISVCQLPLVTNLISLCSQCLPNVKILRVVFIAGIWHCFCPVLVC